MRFKFNKIDEEIEIKFDFMKYSTLIEAVSPEVEPVEIPEIFDKSQILYFKHYLEKSELTDDDKMILNSSIVQPLMDYFRMTPEFFDILNNIKYTRPIYAVHAETLTEGDGYEGNVKYYATSKLQNIGFKDSIINHAGMNYEIKVDDANREIAIKPFNYLKNNKNYSKPFDGYKIEYIEDKSIKSGWKESKNYYENKLKIRCATTNILYEYPDLDIHPDIIKKLETYNIE